MKLQHIALALALALSGSAFAATTVSKTTVGPNGEVMHVKKVVRHHEPRHHMKKVVRYHHAPRHHVKKVVIVKRGPAHHRHHVARHTTRTTVIRHTS